ncbi:MAG: copper resistance protein CopC [Actinomycetota bacterium]|nr:copper resistance protein CopC [Actinomycetota bacterium]
MKPFRVLLVACAALVAAAPAASAHAAYKSSDPADGATVASPPSRVSAEFTEPLTQSSSLQVFDPCGTRVDHGGSTVSGYEMSVSMSGEFSGTYVVDFTAQSSFDSHTTRGSFTFTSSGGSSCAGDPEPTQPPSGGGGGGSGGGGAGGGGGSGDGGAVAQDPVVSTEGSGATSGSGGTGGPRPAGGTSNARNRPARDAGSRDAGPVAFQNTGDRTPAGEPAPWDLPVDGVVIAFALCVMIGAAGGRVYAGIVAPRR